MDKRHREKRAIFWSRLLLWGAMFLLAAVVRVCAPQAVSQAREALLGGQAAQAAFARLRSQVAEGESVVSAFSELYETVSGQLRERVQEVGADAEN